jgi:hypothetical protein
MPAPTSSPRLTAWLPDPFGIGPSGGRGRSRPSPLLEAFRREIRQLKELPEGSSQGGYPRQIGVRAACLLASL